jgi:hypothetical protein
MRMPRTIKHPRHRPLEKVKIAVTVFGLVIAGKMDEKEAGRFLREEAGLHWSLLTCVQYLSGKEAITAIEQLPDGWQEGDLTKDNMRVAIKVAAHAVANVRSDGVALCASDLAKSMKGMPLS